MTASVRDYSALFACLAERAVMPFAWGSAANDCVSYAAAAVKAQTGRDIIATLAPWTTEDEARAALAAHGGLRAAVSAVLREIHPAQAHRGDVAGVTFGQDELLLMIVEGATLVGPAGPGRPGAMRLPRARMTCAWAADQAPAAP